MDESVEMNQEIVLDDAVQASDEPLEETFEEPAEPARKEPGWIRGRIDDAVAKAEARIRAEYEAKLAPIYESMMDRQAEQLVEEGEFKSLERAKEYVRMKGGYTPEVEEVEEEDDPRIEARADMLAQQVEKIKRNRGIDVMEIMENDPNVKARISSGEWDFYDVADYARNAPPAPVRTANGMNSTGFSIKNMSDDQFARLQANLSSGKKYNMRK